MKSLMIGVVLFPMVLWGETVSEKRLQLDQKTVSRNADVVALNERIACIKKNLEGLYGEVQKLSLGESDEPSYKTLLEEVNRLKLEQTRLETSWRETVVQEGIQDGEAYSLWDQEEIPLTQLVMEYGSPDYLYVVPQELSNLKLHLYSNIPIPRQSWSDLLEVMLYHHGIGLKKLNTYARQLYLLKQDLGNLDTVAYCREQLVPIPSGSRICYLILPLPEQVKSIFQFFEKFSDNKQTFIHQLGGKIAIIAIKEEVEKLLNFYDQIWGRDEGKMTKVVPVSKIASKEMEKILTAFFSEALEKGRTPFGKTDMESLGIFSLEPSNSLLFIGSKEAIQRAEKIVKETESQMQDPAEMTVFIYTCRHSNPVDLAQLLEKVYLSLLITHREVPQKETEVFYSSGGLKNVPEGYPPMPPLVVAPPPLKTGVFTKTDIEKGVTEHFIPDPKTGTILMTVRKDALEKIRGLLKQLDIPKKMVQIEVLLFERRINSQLNFGLNLLKLGKTHNGVTYTSLAGPPATKESFSKGVLQFFFHGASPHKYIPRFEIAYNFLMTQDDIHLNAAPSVITVNQTPATISIVEELSINNGAAPIDTNKGTSFEKSFARAQYGITIILVPTIHSPLEKEENGFITLQTNISFDTTKPSLDDRPTVDRRHIENEVRVTDGETVILGGLRRSSHTDHEEEVPFLGRLPFLGKLFGTTQLSNHETEMWFFITPTIVDSPSEKMEKLKNEELRKRPGDIPEFLERLEESKERERNRFFGKSLKVFFTHER